MKTVIVHVSSSLHLLVLYTANYSLDEHHFISVLCQCSLMVVSQTITYVWFSFVENHIVGFTFNMTSWHTMFLLMIDLYRLCRGVARI